MKLDRIYLIFNTIKYLKFKQLFYFVIRRGFKYRSVILNHNPVIRDDISLIENIRVNDVCMDGSTFNFLNKSVSLKSESFNWDPDGEQRLWKYNLHYFDYLRARDCEQTIKITLLSDWVKNNLQGSRPGWEPFTSSLRIVNWVSFLILNKKYIRPDINVVNSLYEQAMWLEKNDESHILANHFFENIKALLFAGMFFSGKEADRWRIKALDLIIIQLDEQILADGGHYEKSPMYHSLMLENMLDIYNLMISNKSNFIEFTDFKLSFIKNKCKQSLDFLFDIVFPGNKIPLFNDSAFNIAPSPDELYNYAKDLFGYSKKSHNEFLISKGDSGLYGFKQAGNMFITDCGDIGPAYQPGHTHCDFLSYELMLDGQMFIVDSGVSEYELGALRQYQRSTKAHNTISVDNGEQSEIWGGFRVARRAQKLQASIIQNYDSEVVFNGEYNGFFNIKGRINHSRNIVLSFISGSDSIKSYSVTDLVTGRGSHSIESYIHLHPEIQILQQYDNRLILESSLGIRKVLYLDSDFSIEEYIYSPEFGINIKSNVVVLSRTGILPIKLTYRISHI